MLTDAQIKELKSKHKELFLVESGDVQIVVRGPTKTEYQVFLAEAIAEAKRPYALHDLAVACVVYPERAAFEGILESFPALAEEVGEKALVLARGSQEVKSKKL